MSSEAMGVWGDDDDCDEWCNRKHYAEMVSDADSKTIPATTASQTRAQQKVIP